jgi:hypothetical protein
VGGGSTGRPAEGVRYVVERAEELGDRIVYRGFVHLPDGDLPLEVLVELPAGATRARIAGGEGEGGRDPRALEREAAALVRSATKSAVQAARPLPRRISRWRG